MPSAQNHAAPQAKGARLALALAVLAVAVAPFVRALGFPFLEWDDDVNFLRNPHVHGLSWENLRWMWTSFHVGHYMPLTWLSCALDVELAGLDPRMFHATNIALHALTALILYAALSELLAQSGVAAGARVAAAFGAMLFAAHPLRVESVVWATERRDVLSGAFVAASVWCWLRAQRADCRRSRWLVASLAAFTASLLSKVSGMALPCVLLALDAWPLRTHRHSGWRPRIAEKLPYFALAGAAAAVGFLGQRWSTDVLSDLSERGVAERVAISAHALRSYLRHTLAPLGLSPFYELPLDLDATEPRYLASIAFALITSGFLFVQRRRSSTLAALWTAWLSFCVLVAPVIGLVHAGRQISADRYTYLPSFAVAALAAAGCARFLQGARAWLGLPVIAALGIGSWIQSGHWKDTRAVFERVIEVEPQSYAGHHKLGILAHQRGELELALSHYDRALAVRPERAHAAALYDRSLTHLALGDDESGLRDLRAALADDSEHIGALNVLSQELIRRGDADAAVKLYTDAVQRAGAKQELLNGLAQTYLRTSRFDEALATAKRLEECAPRSPLGARVAGHAHLYSGRFAAAESSLRRALELAPDDVGTLYVLGLAVSRQGREAQARALYERVLELDPSHSAARQKLGR
ncbi:MAG: tetratricopeptide repeat protein [Planctomycetes bacterium]|nr:tetratricopeptide repeat protein [Planctomycetota bacterium]